jgi:hypothetical protein
MPPDVIAGPKLVAIFMPSLLRLFSEAERTTGSHLTYDLALRIRRQAVGLMVTEEVAEQITKRRGFQDLDPTDFWKQWEKRSPLSFPRCETGLPSAPHRPIACQDFPVTIRAF